VETLRTADEVVKALGCFRDIGTARPDEELLDLAETLIEKKSAKFDPDKFHDRYVDALKELIDKKRRTGERIEAEEEEPRERGGNVVDLMAALKRSIDRPAAKQATTRKPPARKAAAGRKAPARKAAARKRA